MKKRVLVIGPLPPPIGGMETVMEQMKSLKFEDFELIFFNVSKNKIIKSNLIINSLNFMYRCLKLIGILLVKHPEIVHIHTASRKSYLQNNIYHKICKIFHKKTIIHMHGGAFEEFYNNANKRAIIRTLQSADRLIVLTEGWKKFYEKINANKNISVVPNAVDLDTIKTYYKYRKISKTLRLLFVGRVEERKGIFELLESIKILKDKDIHLYIMGPFMNNENEIKELCSTYDITDKITFLGTIQGNDRFKYFANSDIFILPSHYECLPMSILEAMAFGMPVIATEVGAIPEVITKENGIIIKSKDASTLVSSIKQLIQDKKLMKKIIRKNELKIEKKYNMTLFKNNLLESYTKLYKNEE